MGFNSGFKGLMDNELKTMWHEAVVVYFRVKVKVTPWHAFAGNERTGRYNTYPFATPQWKKVSCHLRGPPALPPEKTVYPLYKKLCFKVISQNSVGEQNHKTSIRVVGVPAETRSWYIPNMSQKHHRLTQLVQGDKAKTAAWRSYGSLWKLKKWYKKLLGVVDGDTIVRFWKGDTVTLMFLQI